MFWSFAAILFSGWLYVNASYRGPAWQRRLFKPLTVLLLLLLTWQASAPAVPGYLIAAGLLATLAGDALLLLPTQRLLPALGAFFLSHLLYGISFFSQMTPIFYWPFLLVLLAATLLLIALLWRRLDALRAPVCAFIVMTALMAGGAAQQYFARATDYAFSLLAGTILLLLAHAVWLIHHFRRPFRWHHAIFAACYFGGHFLIVRSLYL